MYMHWQIEYPGDGDIAVLKLAVRERDDHESPLLKQNIFRISVLREMESALVYLNGKWRAGNIRGLVIASAKPRTFCAGADIGEIEKLMDAPRAKTEDLLAEAHSVFLYLAGLRFPTVAAIAGECFGGGLELALFCKARVASDYRKTSFWFPETQLGIIPGFGGTQTAPPLVGFPMALAMICRGKKLSAKKARRACLVDKVVPHEVLLAEAVALAKALAAGRKITRTLPLWDHLLSSALCKWYVFRRAEKEILKETHGAYPAPVAALHAAKNAGGNLFRGQGLPHEVKLFAECVGSPEARNLVRIYNAREKAEKSDWGAGSALPPKRIGIVGAGIMGADIAYAALSQDREVVLHDIDPTVVAQALIRIEALFRTAVREEIFTREEATEKLARFTESHRNYVAFSRVDFAIEAVTESRAIKRKVYDALAEHLPHDAIIATNTSSLPLAEMAAEVHGNHRFLAMHFFNPVHLMPLIEIAGHAGTWGESLARAIAFAGLLKKTPVVLNTSCPGFIVNRVLFHYPHGALEAVLAKKASPYDIDRVFESMGMKMGPFKTLDLVGFGTALSVLKTLSPYYAAGRTLDTGVIADAVKRGILGQKADKGFYLYEKGKKPRPNNAFFRSLGTPSGRWEDEVLIAEKIYARMQEEAQKIVDEGVAPAWATNLACVFGAGITPNKGGLLPW